MSILIQDTRRKISKILMTYRILDQPLDLFCWREGASGMDWIVRRKWGRCEDKMLFSSTFFVCSPVSFLLQSTKGGMRRSLSLSSSSANTTAHRKTLYPLQWQTSKPIASFTLIRRHSIVLREIESIIKLINSHISSFSEPSILSTQKSAEFPPFNSNCARNRLYFHSLCR